MFFEVKEIDESDKIYNLSHVLKNIKMNNNFLYFTVKNYEIFLLFSIAALDEKIFEINSDIFSSKNAKIYYTNWIDNYTAEFLIGESKIKTENY